MTHTNQARLRSGVLCERRDLLDQPLPNLSGLKPWVIVPRVWTQFEAPGGGRKALQLQRPNGNEPAKVSVDVGDNRSFVDELRRRGREDNLTGTKQDFWRLGQSRVLLTTCSLVVCRARKMPRD